MFIRHSNLVVFCLAQVSTCYHWLNLVLMIGRALVLHPRIQTTYFANPLSGWNSDIPERELLCEAYKDEPDALIRFPPENSVVINKIELYLTGSYATHGDMSVLTWWKVCLFEISIVFTHLRAQGSCSILA